MTAAELADRVERAVLVRHDTGADLWAIARDVEADEQQVRDVVRNLEKAGRVRRIAGRLHPPHGYRDPVTVAKIDLVRRLWVRPDGVAVDEARDRCPADVRDRFDEALAAAINDGEVVNDDGVLRLLNRP